MSDLVCGESRVCSLGEQMDALNGNPGKKFPYSAAIVPRRTRTFPVVFAPIPLFLHFTWFECFFFFFWATLACRCGVDDSNVLLETVSYSHQAAVRNCADTSLIVLSAKRGWFINCIESHGP